jgi:hypothetical protein
VHRTSNSPIIFLSRVENWRDFAACSTGSGAACSIGSGPAAPPRRTFFEIAKASQGAKRFGPSPVQFPPVTGAGWLTGNGVPRRELISGPCPWT